MSITEDLADALAQDTIAALDLLDDGEQIIQDVGRVVGATSITTQEAFFTAARVRLSETRARAYLEKRIAEAKAGQAASAPPPSSEDDIEY